ncbi:MAG: hypothetical protein EZS28_015293 [Streblomastix strix]|uniref:EF-hand domain-containing protein n=1 Tax=Streblomastix strix TaxID=222440 RepID=A0A5J4W398_9EUKA|nr:MAG: hypothetical protein EZS28_015293 [Streblomastix strix]
MLTLICIEINDLSLFAHYLAQQLAFFNFSREVLRSQLPNIYVFGEQYFRELFEAQGASPNAAVVENISKSLTDIDTEQTRFELYDKFRATVSDVQFNLNPREIEVAIIEVDIDNDGRINYSEFAKVAAHALDMAQANGPQRHTQERPHVHIHGMLQDEFESTLARKLEEHEAVGNGVLNGPSIRNALKDREVGLTRREVNLIMGHLERKYPDGTFDVNDVAHEAFELLFEEHEDNLLQLPLNEQAAHDVLVRKFQSLDTEKTGKLAVPETQNGLFLADLGPIGLQTHALLGLFSDLIVNVNQVAFADIISSWITQILKGTNLQTLKEMHYKTNF